MNFLTIIPARQNSIRIKNKNLRVVKKKPLIYYTIKEAKKSKYLKKIFVSTDSPNIKDISIYYGVSVPFLRNSIYAKKNSTMHSVVKEFYKKIKNKYKKKFKYIVLLQPTSPNRKVLDIDNACKIMLKNPNADSLVSTCKIMNDKKINKKKIMFTDGKYLSYKKKNKFKDACLRNGPALLITKISKLNKFLIGGKILNYIMPNKRSLDIDNHKDLKKFVNSLKSRLF